MSKGKPLVHLAYVNVHNYTTRTGALTGMIPLVILPSIVRIDKFIREDDAVIIVC